LKQRVQVRKARAKEQILGAKKHEMALKEMARRKQESDAASKKRNIVTGPTIPKVQMAKKGISTGQKTKNKHMQDFESMKSGFRKRQEDLNKRMTNAPKSGIENRFVSQTAPIYAQPHPSARPKATTTAKPANTTAPVRITRRTNAPSAPATRRVNAPTAKPTMPAIAVTGMGGLRVLKQQNQIKGRR
jgi:hypothetical protein